MESSNKEIIFVVEDDENGGYNCRALGYSIFTQGDTWDEVEKNVREAVLCHFDDGKAPRLIHLHYVRDQVIAV